MFHWPLRMVCAAAALAALATQAAPPPSGLSFTQRDWELHCDNTRTCRAAGYHPEDSESPAVSVLLTRAAGPHTPVTGRVRLGDAEEEERPLLSRLPEAFDLTLRIDGREVGRVRIDRDAPEAVLSAEQVAALLAALPRKTAIRFATAGASWQLSVAGASAVLLKMDDAQGRVGTPGALIKKGARDEQQVPPPRPAPRLHVPAPEPASAGDERFGERHSAALQRALARTVPKDDCPNFFRDRDQPLEWQTVRVSPRQMLVSTSCWWGSYTGGDGYWVVNERPPFQPVLVTTAGTGHDSRSIDADHKGRGPGDCWRHTRWVWNGTRFVMAQERTTGLCRMVTLGGPWELPTYVSETTPVTGPPR